MPVMTKLIRLSWGNIFIMTNIILLWQTHVCRDKTWLLSHQNHASIIFVATNMLQQIFVTTKVLLWQTKTHICHDKTLDATKMVLVASPAKDIKQPWVLNRGSLNFCACGSLLWERNNKTTTATTMRLSTCEGFSYIAVIKLTQSSSWVLSGDNEVRTKFSAQLFQI